MEYILGWIFDGFLGAKTGEKFTKIEKIDIGTELNFDRVWKASWSTTFSAKRRPRRAAGAAKRVGPRRATAQGRIMEGFGKILTRILETLLSEFSTLVPDGAAD